MVTQLRIKSGEYYDSITLLNVSQTLMQSAGILDAAVVMGTPANITLLENADLLVTPGEKAQPNDLIIAIKGLSNDQILSAFQLADSLLSTKQTNVSEQSLVSVPHTLTAAIKQMDNANIVLISVAGTYAAEIAYEALSNDKHVFLFSDNVSLEDEVRLKEFAQSRGLYLMGPDAGTAIINGISLGFANKVISGPVGIVAASGTGLQSVSSALTRKGTGISQAIGVGGRDLSPEVGGKMMIQGYQALQSDPETEVIILISKPPAPKVTRKLLKLVSAGIKPTVVCFLGNKSGAILAAGGIPALTLDEAAAFASAVVRGESTEKVIAKMDKLQKNTRKKAAKLKSSLNPQQKYYRGLFSGGTFCYETQEILGEMLGIKKIRSNTPLSDKQKQPGANKIKGHIAVDLGADEYTVGRLHPMLDPTLRNRLLLQYAMDPQTAVIYVDIVLGFGVHPDPAGAVIPVIQEAETELRHLNREVIFTASVCGTSGDPQNANNQVEKLKKAGVKVLNSNASAAFFAGYLLS